MRWINWCKQEEDIFHFSFLICLLQTDSTLTSDDLATTKATIVTTVTVVAFRPLTPTVN